MTLLILGLSTATGIQIARAPGLSALVQVGEAAAISAPTITATLGVVYVYTTPASPTRLRMRLLPQAAACA
jgi:hypothetical protein